MDVLVTGGLGFIGSNYVMQTKNACGVVDARRRGALNDYNLERVYGKPCSFNIYGDVAYRVPVEAIQGADAVIHLAAQVAVTKSIEEPMYDFESNALGTLNILEAVRRYAPKAHVIYASTNKVYGDNPHGRFDPSTPYGVSKSVGDLYCQEYSKTYGLRTTVLRQSCIYGPHQDFTSVDQGWVCHIAGQILQDREVTIFGDGTQVRDLLYVDDLVELYDLILDKSICGVYDVGGGEDFAISVNEAILAIEHISGKKAKVKYAPWRPHDQKRYVSDVSTICDFGWRPKIVPSEGIERMVENIKERLK